jgi:hypothetical protein
VSKGANLPPRLPNAGVKGAKAAIPREMTIALTGLTKLTVDDLEVARAYLRTASDG